MSKVRSVQILSFPSEVSSLLSQYKLLVFSLKTKQNKQQQQKKSCNMSEHACMPHCMHACMRMNRRMTCSPSTVVLGIKQVEGLGSNLAKPFPIYLASF